ncbi:helix-turn-helix domain-containing protein [Enterococcus sp. HY326]|uniref:helix-turn-helix domain-containing protein n=1 Tax=Enterococcus sp. HY326 TaxID=2971265 RepID=UPI00223F740D|nr:helix-turn-helix domain-containing protein [Enterococcus sp. HY326]
MTYAKIIKMLDAGKPIKMIAEETGVSRPTIYKIKRKYCSKRYRNSCNKKAENYLSFPKTSGPSIHRLHEATSF